MNLDHTKRTYEKLGREDPFYAVLTVPKYRHNRWDVGEFFANGRQEIDEVLAYVERLAPGRAKRMALDFGCGVGRLTQALANHFEKVVGVDIAESMVETARKHNEHGEKVEYLVNSVDDLSVFGDAHFDFIYSSITLQHIPPDANRRYVAEFMRILRPGGVAVFQVPNGKPLKRGSFSAWLYTIRRSYLRRFWKAIRGKPTYEMHYIPRVEVERIIADGGGTLIDAVPFGQGGVGQNFRYLVSK